VNNPKKRLKSYIIQSVVLLATIMAIISTAFCVSTFAQPAHEGESIQTEMTKEAAEVTKFGFIAAAIAFGLGAIGAGIAISHVGAAAMGAVAEKPEVAGQALIFVALAEGLVIFGFITALMILGKV
jgi:V/A-type H+-transporting ATPase subunit K